MNEESSSSSHESSGNLDRDLNDIIEDDDDDELDSWEEELFEINCLNEPLDTIKEEEDDEEEEERESVFSIDFKRHKHDNNNNNNKDVVCVCVDDDDGSFDALSWTLKHMITPSSTTLCLLHVFPFSRLIPSPLGKLPRYHANRVYIDYHLEQVKGKRKVLLQKFIDLCTASQVKVEPTLIEGDNVAKAIVQHVKNHGITKLVIGTTKSNLSKTGHSRRNAIADQVVKNVPENCDIKIICEGKDVIFQIIQNASPSPASSDSGTPTSSSREEDESHGFLLFKKFFGPKISSPR